MNCATSFRVIQSPRFDTFLPDVSGPLPWGPDFFLKRPLDMVGMARYNTIMEMRFPGEEEARKGRKGEGMEAEAMSIADFAALVEREQRENYDRMFRASAETRPEMHAALRDAACRTRIVPGRKFTKVDVGTSGKYMVDNATGEIFGIKAYGVVHRGHRYGSLRDAESIKARFYGGYRAELRPGA